MDRCPYCQQIVDSQRKKNLLKALGKVLEAQIKNHVSNQLNQFRINDIQLVEWTKFEALNKSDLVENCKNAIEALKGKITFVNRLLEEKINNPYKALTVEADTVEFNAAYESAVKYAQTLNEAVEDYNKAIKEHKKLEEKLVDLNNDIVFWEIYELNEELKVLRKGMECRQILSLILGEK